MSEMSWAQFVQVMAFIASPFVLVGGLIFVCYWVSKRLDND